MDPNKNELMVGRNDTPMELAPSGYAAMFQAEINAAMTAAVRFGRDEDEAYSRMMKACERPSFQEGCVYRFPRADKMVVGPSVGMAREFARVWGHIRYGFDVVSDAEDLVQLRGYAWDLVTGLKVTQDAAFKKLVYRRKGGWQRPDERDLRELVNKHGAICERNCLLKTLPKDMVEDIIAQATRNQKRKVQDDLEQSRKAIITAFSKFNVTPKELEEHLGMPLRQMGADEVVMLRQIWTSIHEGNSRWAEYKKPKEEKPAAKAGKGLTDLMPETAEPAPDAAPDPEPDVAVETERGEAWEGDEVEGQLEPADATGDVVDVVLGDTDQDESRYQELKTALEQAQTAGEIAAVYQAIEESRLPESKMMPLRSLYDAKLAKTAKRRK